MRSNYKKLGQFIRVVDSRNKENRKDNLLGVSTQKVFIDSVANTVGTDFKKYKIVRKHQFTYVPDTSRRGDKIGIAMLESLDQALVSQAYTVFEVIDSNLLDPEYLMMWFRRPEFDRYARFKSHGSVREIFDWQEMCDVELPVPSIEEQREIVREYNVVNDRIALNEQLTQKLEDTAQAIYKQWFVDFEFPISKEYAESIGKPELEGKPYKSSGGEMEYSEDLERDAPKAWGAIPIKSFTKEMKSGGTPKRDVEEYWNSKDVPWLKTGEVANCVITDAEEYISELGLKESSAKVYPKNTVLMAMYGDGKTKGQVGFLRVEAATNQACCSMQCKNVKDASFLYYYLRFNYQEIVRSAIGGAQENLSKGLIENINILNVDKDLINRLPFDKFIDCSENYVKENIVLKALREVILQKVSKA
ncbi:restriction endonuclease subunit S [Vibrio metschnikovii]|nr:restriction endonuclease subunit S [Vibrio metschnikovii]EKO3726482.1 restriction endonuclease subunit S [Vibrio metschnikovii]EKO3880409.1 restriction endonuclease subunit S [Vibrio metschnikovii]EKO3938466.1 restriction endonuclease subunit S [Vibrio metschnikovii]